MCQGKWNSRFDDMIEEERQRRKKQTSPAHQGDQIENAGDEPKAREEPGIMA